MAGLETDDLIKQYLKSDDKPSKASSSSVMSDKLANDALISQYMNGTRPKAGAPPTGYNSATGQTTYDKPSEVTTGSHTRSTLDIPVNAAKAVGGAIKDSVLEAGEGLGDVLSGKPASGLGKVGMGALGIVGSPAEAVRSVVGDVTGNKSVADRASLVAGGVLPVVPSAKAIKSAIPSNRALKDITEAIGPENAGRVAAEMRADPRLTPADLSPSVKQSTQQIFVLEGDKAKQHVADAVAERIGGAKQAAQDALDTNLGQAVDPFAKVQELKSNIKAVGAKDIQPAVANAKPVDITPAIKYIDDTLKPGINSIIENPENLLPYDKVQKVLAKFRENLTNDQVNAIDAQQLHKLQSGIRRTADTLIRSTDGESKAMGYALYGLRSKIVDAIDAASPQVNGAGTYKTALAKYRDENHIQDAFEHGHDAILKNSANLENHPSFFKDWVKNATDTEKEAARQGARVAIDSAIKSYRTPATNPNSKAVQLSQVDFNRDRIEALFGKEEAGRLFKKLENERIIADTNNKLVEGSQTAMRSAANERVALPEKSNGLKSLVGPAAAEALNLGGAYMTGATLPGAGAAAYGLMRGASAVKDKIATAMAKERNTQFAKYALPTEAPAREELIRHLEAVAAQHNTPRLTAGNKASLLFSRTP